ncbi:MAG TPA: hypothetical protein VLJ42_01085 [Solirubrobacteraceae bacterium]|nr:hypothetical protein [Solirubrobacteraceae bacterium]
MGSVVAVAASLFDFALGFEEAVTLSLAVKLLGDFGRLAFLAADLARRAHALIVVIVVIGRHLLRTLLLRAAGTDAE